MEGGDPQPVQESVHGADGSGWLREADILSGGCFR